MADDKTQRLIDLLRGMLRAIENGGIDSEELPGDPDAGIPPYKWHEEWASYTRDALDEYDAEQRNYAL